VSTFLLIVHLVAVVLAVGPVTVAASMFAPAARAAALESAATDPPSGVLAILQRICRVYSALGLFVPVFGLATAASLGVLTDAWILTSIGLTIGAGAVLALLILPGQAAVVAGVESGAGAALRPDVARLGMFTGVFNLLWFAVLVLMVLRPGSTIGSWPAGSPWCPAWAVC
jgi:hypothetical protein